MDSAALPNPEVVGWSGILSRKVSNSFLKASTLLLSLFLSTTGSKLKILAPFTPKEDSLALLTDAGEEFTTSCGRAVLPRRLSAKVTECLLPPVRSLKRKFGLKKDFEMGLG